MNGQSVTMGMNQKVPHFAGAWTAFLLLLLSLLMVVSADQDAKRLYEDLLTDYNRLIRPVGNNSDRLTVKLGLKLSQLIDVVSDDTKRIDPLDDRNHPKLLLLYIELEESDHDDQHVGGTGS